MNTAYATHHDGRHRPGRHRDRHDGLENQFLGCDQKHAVLAGGRAWPGRRRAGHARPTATRPLARQRLRDRPARLRRDASTTCSWADRIVIPLSFAPTPSVCSFKQLRVLRRGLADADRAMASWVAQPVPRVAGADASSTTRTVAEPLAVRRLASGAADVALTTQPASAQQIVTQRHYLYAPVAVSAVSIAYWVDNPTTGLPVTTLKLDQRLARQAAHPVLQLPERGRACGAPPPPVGIGCDNGVDGNPQTLFADPEFQQLNPAVQPVSGLGAAFQVPTVESGQSDMTWTVTRWISRQRRRRRVPGRRSSTPGACTSTPTTSACRTRPTPSPRRTPTRLIQHRYSPLFPLSLVASYQVENWEPGTSWAEGPDRQLPQGPDPAPGTAGPVRHPGPGRRGRVPLPGRRDPQHRRRVRAPTKSAMAAALTAT